MVSFVITGEIETKARPRARVVNGKFAQMYTPKTTANFENLIKLSYQQATCEYFEDKPLRATIVAHFKAPNSLERFAPDYPACTKHKDLDNIAKTVLDALNKVAYDDDKNVHELECSKVWDEKEFIEVTLIPLGMTESEKSEDLRLQKMEDRYNELLKEYELKGKLPKAKMERMEQIYLELQGTSHEVAPIIS